MEEVVEIRKRLQGQLGEDFRPTYEVDGERLRELRLKLGLDQKVLAGKIHVGNSRYSRLETTPGKKLEVEKIETLREFFGCEDFFEIAIRPVQGPEPFRSLNQQTEESFQITEELAENFQPGVEKLSRIHTLLNPDCDITTIYHPPDLVDTYQLTQYSPQQVTQRKFPQELRFKVHTLDNLNSQQCLILGTAGQGKSLLLRHLVIAEWERRASLPLFVELRRLGKNSLQEYLQERFQQFSIEQDFHEVLGCGLITLFLDGFDELEISSRHNFLSELRRLGETYPKLKFVLTSRPDSGILTCNWLKPFTIAPLTTSDIYQLVKVYATAAEAEQILSLIHRTSHSLMELLSSPIFVVLLVVKFRYSETIPEDLTAFYRDLFDALVRRQNFSDGGPKRTVQSQLLPYDLETAFREICFLIHEEFGDRPPHLRQAEEIAVRVADRMTTPVESPPLIVSDVIQLTNLLLEEAGYCFYIHKTVREYFAAAFVASLPQAKARLAYARMAKNWSHWRYILEFLANLDSTRMAVMFELPELEAWLQYGPQSYLTAFNSITIVKAHTGQEQLRISGGKTFFARDQQIVCGSIFPDCVKKGFAKWCLSPAYPNLQPGQQVVIPLQQINYPKLLEWLDDNLQNGYTSAEQRLTQCRQTAKDYEEWG